MRRTTRTFAGALLAAGLGLSGCAFGDDEADLDGTGVPPVYLDEEEVGDPDRVDGGEEDADGIDPGTGGIQEDDEIGLEGDDPDTVEDTPFEAETEGETGAETEGEGEGGVDSGPDTVEDGNID